MRHYRYGFNGKENDDEVKGNGNEQDYGARIYGPCIGRWMTTDPKQKQYQNQWTYTYYVRDASGNVMASYDRQYLIAGACGGGTIIVQTFKQKEHMIYGSSRLGLKTHLSDEDEVLKSVSFCSSGADSNGEYVNTGTIGSTTFTIVPNFAARLRGKKQYEMSNHLGNVMVTLSDKKQGVNVNGSSTDAEYYMPDVISSTDNFAFGQQQRAYNTTGTEFGFNGKREDAEVYGEGNSYDYGARIYDPRLAKFLSVDPLQTQFAFYSPYQFAGNMPIAAIDIDGLEPASMIDNKGKLTMPIITLLSSSFDYDPEYLKNTTWKGVDKVNISNSSAMTVYSEVSFKKSLNNLYIDRDWLELIAHEQKHRDEIGNNVSGSIWYFAYGINWMRAGFSYEDNEAEERAYSYGASVGSKMSKIIANSNVIEILNNDMMPLDEKTNRMRIIGLEYKLSELESELINKELYFGKSLEEVKAKTIDPIKWQITAVKTAIQEVKERIPDFKINNNVIGTETKTKPNESKKEHKKEAKDNKSAPSDKKTTRARF